MNLVPMLPPMVVASIGKLSDAPRRDRREKARERSAEQNFSRKLDQAIERTSGSRVNVKV